MGLRQEIKRNTQIILADEANGFAWPLVVTDPSGKSVRTKGFTCDIADLIDPETGQAVSGRMAEVTIHMEELRCAGMAHPAHIQDGSGKPWTFKFDDLYGTSHTFKVQRVSPDRTTGLILCCLEAYVP